MFENIGEKIKSLASIICWFGIVASIAVALFLFASAPEDGVIVIFSMVILILGPLISWLSTCILYGYGELISKSCEITMILHKTSENVNTSSASQPSKPELLATLDKWLENGLITEEEYNNKINQL